MNDEKQLPSDQVTSVPKSLIAVGVPIQFPIYDIHGRLLMAAGTVVTSDDQLERLQERGLYFNKKTADQLPSSKVRNKGEEGNKDQEAEKEPPQRLVPLPLESIALGESIQISPLTDESNSTKYIIKFIGGLKKNSLICTAPTLDDKLVFIKEHSGFLVRLFSGKEVYNFTTTVSAVHNKPFPHIHLKFPSGAYVKSLRKNERVQTSIICSIVNKAEGDFKDVKFSGFITDLSLGGAMVESPKQMGNSDDKIECTFKLAVNEAEVLFSIPCVLRKIIEPAENDKSAKYNHGIQFEEIPAQEKIMLQIYVFQLVTGKNLNDL